ncbi:MAG: flavocytochrome c [Betaproteobacteria bacterium]|nr:flavocytochrome c [Betaproteobacteria bacterium]
MNADVVVVGGGLAGLSAAMQAANHGAQVLLLEKLARTGGSSELSGGLFAFAGTDMQKAAGIEDNDQRLYEDIRRAGQFQNDEALVRTYVAHQLAAYEWLKQLGAQFKTVEVGAGQSTPRAHAVNSQAFMDLMAERAKATPGVTIEYAARATRLLTGASGRVTGVAAVINGRAVDIHAKRGVVLAAGGFARNAGMVKLFVPLQEKAIPYCGPGSTGDGVRMAWALGAGLADVAHIKGTFGFHPDTGKSAGRDWSKHAVYRGAIAVNQHAQRYVDESQSYKLLGDAVLLQPGAMAYQIFDRSVFDSATEADGPPLFRFKEALALGRLLTAPTLDALAQRIGLDAQALNATIERYNGFVRNGRDQDFGRAGLSTTYGKLVELKRAPWYAYPSTSGLIATYCGVTVDIEARVLNVYGEPIAGLYAAGEMTGGFHGVAYMTGSSLGKCVIFGRIAGRQAAAFAR